MGNLWTPWRLAYLAAEKGEEGCIFCEALAGSDDERSLVVHRGRHAFALLNRYPYASGHVMIAPAAHVSRLAETPPEALEEVLRIAARCESVLGEVFRPHGFNLGLNLGRAAGAGIAGHIHLHVVPRWDGDTNFMTVFSDVRIIPERLEDTWRKLSGRLG